MTLILRFADYTPPPDHGCHGKGCALCCPLRTEAEVISLRARREAAAPRCELPADVEDGSAA